MISVVLLLAALSPVSAATPGNLLDWNGYLDALAAGKSPGVVAICLGSEKNRLPRMVRSGEVKAKGMPFIVIDANGSYCNPMSGGQIKGSRLFALWAGTAGTLLFLDDDGLVVPQLNLPQFFHSNDKEVLEAYMGFAKGRFFREMSLRDYLQAVGKEQVILKIQKRRGNWGNWSPILPEHPLPTIVADNGEPVDPRRAPGTFYVFGNPEGRAFRAQLRELRLGLASLRPPIVAVVPSNTKAEAIAALDVPVMRTAASVALEPCSPRMLLVARDGSGQWMYGFHPKDMLAMHLKISVTNLEPLQAQIPFTETDTGSLLSTAHALTPSAATAGARP